MWLCLDTWWELHALLFCYSFSSSPAAWRLYVIYRIEMLKLKGLFHFWDSCLALNLNYRSLWNIFSFLYLRKHWGVLVGLNPSAIFTTLNCYFCFYISHDHVCFKFENVIKVESVVGMVGTMRNIRIIVSLFLLLSLIVF